MSWRSSVVVLGVVLVACGGSSDDAGTPTAAPSTPTVAGATTSVAVKTDAPATAQPSATAPPVTGVAPQGFDRVAARITAADGETCDVCLWLAADPATRAQGLMGVTDLSGADGMLFRWDEATTSAFWMRDTPTPLSIAFFAADGTFVSAVDMAPCLAPTPDGACARYPAAAPYVQAIEVAQGALPALLIGPGSTLEVFDAPCPPGS